MPPQKKLKRHDWNVTQVNRPNPANMLNPLKRALGFEPWTTEPLELQPYYDVLDDIESRYEMAESKAERGKLEKLHTKWNNMRPSWFHTGKYPREGAMPGFGRLETRTAYSTGGGGSRRDVLVHEDPLPKINRYWEDRKSEVREVYSGELSGEPMSKSIDDIMQQSNIAEFLSKSMSDRTNVETTNKEIKQLLPGRRDIDMFMQAMFPDVYEQHQRSMLEKKLIDLAKEKPIKG